MKLSVIIPCYNVAGRLPTLVRSLHGNLRGDFEFVFVEDGSTDRTAAVLDKLTVDLPGARVLRHEANRGLSAARNTGLARAGGTYLAWLDADDWIGPGYLDQLVRVIERLGCEFVRTDHVRVTGRRRTVVRSPETRRNLVIPPRSAIAPPFRSTSVDYPMAWAGVHHRKLAERGLLTFDENLRTCADRHWVWRLHRAAESFATVGLLGVFHRHGEPDSLSQLDDDRHLHFLDAMALVLAETRADPEADLLLPKAVDATCALINFHVTKRAQLSLDLQQRLVERSIETLDAMPQDVLEHVLSQGSPRRRSLLTRMRRNPAALATVA
ncbi:glycosyltransferase family 2 protein [Micropruina sp.]|uniref:glycosyltransferase family 2 protein n=1 Tax=Micropruina sp. TaxID=2737536 RepID=UPI0039E40BF1